MPSHDPRQPARAASPLLDAIQTPVLLLDGSGRIGALNRAAEAVFPVDAAGTFFWTHFPSDAVLRGLFEDVPSAGARARTTSAERRTIDWTFTPHGDDAIVASGVDVTDEERQRVVVDFAFSALTEHDPDGLLKEACATLRQACGCDCVSVLRHVPGRGFAVAAATGEHRDDDPHALVPDDEAYLAGYAFRADGPVLFDDLERETRFKAPVARQLGFLSGVASVINGAYAPFGMILAVSKQKSAFSERDVQLIQSIALYLEAAMARRAAEDETHRMRRDYARLIEIAQEGILVLDTDGRVTFANAKAGTIFGIGAAELVGRHYLDAVSAEDRSSVRRHAERRQRYGPDTSYDARLVRCDGSLVWASIAVSSMTDDQGNVTGTLAMISDISERVRAEQELRRRETQLREAQRIAQIGSFEFDLGAQDVFWSDELYRIAGLEPQAESVPLTHDFIFNTFVPGMEREQVIACLESGDSFDLEHEFLRADGGPARFVRARARLVTDESTGAKRVVGSVQDITEERAARQELLAREGRLRLLVSQLPVIMWSTDRTLTITSIVGAGVRADRATEELQLHVSHLFGDLDRDPAAALEGQALTFEVEREGRNLRVHIEPLRDPASDVVGTVGFAFDITEQKRSERAHQELLEIVRCAALEWTETFDSIASPVVLLDEALRVTRLNKAALELAGSAAYGEAVGLPITELGSSLLWQEFAAAARSASELRAPVAVRVTTGDDRRWDVVASPWSNAERTTIVASDVTAIARMQERLQRSERMSAVGDLVAGVAHEVRNPLFGISATLDAFEARHGDQQFRTYTAALREQLDRMNELMHDLLEFGRPSPTVLVPGSIASVIATAQSSVRALAAREGVEIRADIPDSLPEVAMSAQRLVQVFDNLLENAIQHSTRGQTVEIRAWYDEEDRAVVVAVEDRGPGFRVEDLGRIFEPFFTLRSGGTGLGLSLVQRIVDDHNGDILALNREDGGAQVLVAFPV